LIVAGERPSRSAIPMIDRLAVVARESYRATTLEDPVKHCGKQRRAAWWRRYRRQVVFLARL
jgi:hypothetical protein